MKLAVFGGSFNPPHIGHLIVLESVRDQLQFEKVLLIPSAEPPNKPAPTLAAPPHRLEMTRLAVEGKAEYEVSDIEIRRRGISYTVDTIKEISALYRGSSISLIIGADNLLEFETWKSPSEILSRADLVVMSRPGFNVK
jgi:nicotinate-nucleotide adenylyltransferase